MARPFSQLRDRILADPVRAARLDRVRAEAFRVYYEQQRPRSGRQ